MFYDNWMSYIKDDAKLTKIAMPGSHNSASLGMMKLAECQGDLLSIQYEKGVRMFDLRLKSRHGEPYMGHSVATGISLEKALTDINAILRIYPEDFFLICLKCYPNQPVGPITLKYSCDPERINELIEEKLEPEKYAFTDFEDINDVTIGDIRKSGKRYIIHNAGEEYRYSRNAEVLDPWDGRVFGLKPEKFAKEGLKYLRELDSKGFFWLQTQQTSDPGSEIGFPRSPEKVDRMDRPYFPGMMKEIAENKEMLDKVNIVAGDYMTADLMKINEILNFNLLKDYVIPEKREEYAAEIGKEI